MIIYNPKNVAIISDLHCGVHRDSELWHKILLDYGVWLKNELVSKQIKDLLVLGDIFHDREEIGVQTLATVEQFFKILMNDNNPINVILLNGNHDSFYRDKSDINSISIFKGWPNITVIDTPVRYGPLDKASETGYITFLPWGCDVDTIQPTSILFGHFEINSFKMNGNKICEKGLSSDKFLEKSPLIFTGHFHGRNERSYDDKKIIYVGNTFQQNWGETLEEKGYYILNMLDHKYEFIPNTVSPKYYKLLFSKFLDKNNFAELKKLIPNNFIKIQVDTDIDYTKIEKLLLALNILKPLELSTEFAVKKDDAVLLNHIAISLDTKALFLEYIENMEIQNIKDKVIQEFTQIYESSITKINISSNT
jgi:DNA repair exonuclease SbcCD nuclease subunit